MFHRICTAVASWVILYNAPGLRAQERYFTSHGVRIHYTLQGKGEPVVLIHGFSVNYPFQWVYPGISAALAKNYCVIGLDCRGHGKSGKPHDPRQYGVEMVEDVVRLLDHLQIKRAHIVGYSMGGFIALKMLALYPERVLTVTTGGAGLEKKIDQKFLDELAVSLDQGKGIGPLLIRLTPAGLTPPTPEQLRLNTLLLSAFNDQKALAAVIRGLKSLNVSEDKLKANKIPTLALVGAYDPLREGVEQLKQVMPGLTEVVIENADHMDAFFKPEFVQALKAFLAQHPETPAAANGKPATAKDKIGTNSRK
jgi:pimeloyl-ACP methyl ester carboxylesterase